MNNITVVAIIVILSLAMLTSNAYAGGIKEIKPTGDYQLESTVFLKNVYSECEQLTAIVTAKATTQYKQYLGPWYSKKTPITNALVELSIADKSVRAKTVTDGSARLYLELWDLPLNQFYNATITTTYDNKKSTTKSEFYLYNLVQNVDGTPCTQRG